MLSCSSLTDGLGLSVLPVRLSEVEASKMGEHMSANWELTTSPDSVAWNRYAKGHFNHLVSMYPDYGPEGVLHYAGLIAEQLDRLESNNKHTIPAVFAFNEEDLKKKYTPIRKPCPKCKTPKSTLRTSVHKVVYPHVEDLALEAMIFDGDEFIRAKHKFLADSHNEPESIERWQHHVLGFTPAGELFSRGVYTIGEGGLVKNMAWDFDSTAMDPEGRARAVVSFLAKFNLLHATYLNKSAGGSGRHLHLATEPVPQWFAHDLAEAVCRAVGMTPGNDPKLGQTECNPKQWKQDLRYGNLLGASCSLMRMPNGRLNLIRPWGGWDEPVYDPAETLTQLQNVRPATLDELRPLAESLGLNPDVVPEKYQPKKPQEPTQRTFVATSGKTAYVKQSASEGRTRLRNDVISRITPADFLAHFAGRAGPDSGAAHYFCVLHNETENDRSFNVYTNERTGQPWWKCLGDCDADGNVVELAKRFWRTSWQQALFRLAETVGLDPDAPEYRVQAEILVDPFADDAEDPNARDYDVKVEETEEVEEKPKPATPTFTGRDDRKKRPIPTLEGWTRANFVRVERKDRADFFRATTRVLLSLSFDPTEITEGLFAGSDGYYRTAEDLHAVVLEVQDRIRKEERVAGRPWLLRNVGAAAMHGLSHVVQLALLKKASDKPAFMTSMRGTIGFSHIEGDSAEWLKGLRGKYGSEGDHTLNTILEGDTGAVTRALNAFARPTACCRFSNKKTGIATDGSSDLGTTKIVCESRLCLYCASLKLSGIETALQKKWDPERTYHFVRVTVPRLEDIDAVRACVAKRAKRPKVTILGFEGGLPTITFVADESFKQIFLAAAVRTWAAMNYRARPELYDIEPEVWGCDGVEAIDTVMDTMTSFYVHGRQLVDERREEELVQWIAWSDHKQIARRSKGSVYWPTEKELKEQRAKSEDAKEPMAGTEVTYTLIHNPTGMELGRRVGRPYTIDEARRCADASRVLNVKLEEIAARQAA